MKEINAIFINSDWIYSKHGKIETFIKNGEMAPVEWFRQGNLEFNGKYVEIVEFKEDNK